MNIEVTPTPHYCPECKATVVPQIDPAHAECLACHWRGPWHQTLSEIPTDPEPGKCEGCGADLTKPHAIYASTDGWYSFQANVAESEPDENGDTQTVLHVDCASRYLSDFQRLDEVACAECGHPVEYDDDSMDGEHPDEHPAGTGKAACDLIKAATAVENAREVDDLAAAVRELVAARDALLDVMHPKQEEEQPPC